MLRACDAPLATFKSIGKHPQTQWLTDQAKERLEPSAAD
jgi:hypothetical protein